MEKRVLIIMCLFIWQMSVYATPYSCPPLTVDGKPRTDAVARQQLLRCIKEAPDTFDMHFNKITNQFDKKRQLLHAKILKKYQPNERYCVKNKKPLMLLIGGGMGAGKTTYLETHWPFIFGKKVFYISADAIREYFPEYKSWNASNTQKEAGFLANQFLQSLQESCRFNTVFDSSMSDLAYMQNIINTAHRKGYTVYAVYIDVPYKIALTRAMHRYKTTGRYVEPALVKRSQERSKATFKQLKNKVDGYIQVDGVAQKTVAKGGKPVPQQW